MPTFQLDGQWISGYIGVIGGLVAFVIGVSALVFQVALPSYLRTLTRRRHLLRYTIALMVFYLLASILLIWIAPLSADGLVSPEWTLLIDAVMTFTLAATIGYAIYQLLQINGDSIVRGLMRDCMRDYRERGEFAAPSASSKRRITPSRRDLEPASTLETLIDIGAQSSPGFEKERVLDALFRLAEFVFYDPKCSRVYDGRKLNGVINGFEEVLTGGILGSQENFKTSAKALRFIMIELCRNEGKYAGEADMGAVMQVCAALGILSIKHYTQAVADDFVSAISIAESRDRITYRSGSAALREIGIAAIKVECYGVVVAAINALINWDEEPFTSTDDGSAEMLGLWAHLWNANEGGKQHIRALLSMTEERFYPSFAACLSGAIDHHFDLSHFDTHAALLQFRDDLTG